MLKCYSGLFYAIPSNLKSKVKIRIALNIIEWAHASGSGIGCHVNQIEIRFTFWKIV